MDGTHRVTGEARILALLKDEIEAFQRCDFLAWSALWVQDDRARDMTHSHPYGTTVMRGWDEIAPAMVTLMEERGSSAGAPYHQFDHNLTVRGDVAWVTYRTRNKDPLCPTDLCEELRILERGDDGLWRFVCMSVAASGSKERLAGAVEVDADGTVLWTGDLVAGLLTDHPVLAIIGGRRVSRRPAEGDGLRDAMANAAALARTNLSLDPSRMDEPVTFPVVLGIGEDGAGLICIVRIADSRVFVDLTPEADIARRLRAGAILFGLSDAQTAVVREIATGASLPEVAERAGTSVATTRTHLARIYEKTGVNSQTALIRLLLSVG